MRLYEHLKLSPKSIQKEVTGPLWCFLFFLLGLTVFLHSFTWNSFLARTGGSLPYSEVSLWIWEGLHCANSSSQQLEVASFFNVHWSRMIQLKADLCDGPQRMFPSWWLPLCCRRWEPAHSSENTIHGINPLLAAGGGCGLTPMAVGGSWGQGVGGCLQQQ